MVGREVIEVLYSPVKAFRKIIEKPDIKGVILVLVLAVSSIIIYQYVEVSNYLLETRTPATDDWTELLPNQHNWTSNGLTTLDNADYQMGNLDGNHSVSSSVPAETSAWLRLTNIEPINCSEAGQKELFFWIKWTSEGGLSPSSGTLKLFSGSEDSYFESDITGLLSSGGEWANPTLNVGADQGWASTNSPDWQSITGVEFRLDWSSSANLTMKIDGLFFRKFVPSMEVIGVGGLIQVISIASALPFIVNWILWAAILAVVAKLFQADLGRWTTLIIIIGYSFVATAVTTLASTPFIATLPPLNYYFDLTITEALRNELWAPLPAYQAALVLQLIGRIWTTALAAVVVRLKVPTTWRNALFISVVAFGVNFVISPLVQLFLGF